MKELIKRFEQLDKILRKVVVKNYRNYQNLSYELGSLILFEGCITEIEETFELANCSIIIIDDILNEEYMKSIKNSKKTVS